MGDLDKNQLRYILEHDEKDAVIRDLIFILRCKIKLT